MKLVVIGAGVIGVELVSVVSETGRHCDGIGLAVCPSSLSLVDILLSHAFACRH